MMPRLKTLLRALGLGLASLLAGGCHGPRGPMFNPRAPQARALTNFTAVGRSARIDLSLLQAPTNLFRLGPGDAIDIDFFQEPTLRAAARVGPDGTIYYYLLPGLDVWGLTLPQTADLLQRQMSRYFNLTNDLHHPASPAVGVTLLGVQSQHIWLLGQFQSPGVYPLTGPTTLLEAISMAGGARMPDMGGAEDLADLRHSFVVRQGRILPVDFYQLLAEGDASQNIYLQPGDFVYLPSAQARDIYVLGRVRLPRRTPYSEPATLVWAISSAGGLVRNAYATHVAIVRGSLAHPEIAVVDYNQIVHGKATDVLLAPGDIVFVPSSPYRLLTKYAELIVRTFADVVAINEGARAVIKNAAPVGVGIIANPVAAPATVAPVSP